MLALLFGGAIREGGGSPGLQRRFLLGIERIALGLPLQFNAGAIVLDVAGRVAVQVADVETGALAFLVALSLDAMAGRRP